MKYLPNCFKPKKLYDLIRIGSDYDGGYLCEKKSIKSSRHLVSGGLSCDINFEKHFQDLTGCKVTAFDPAVNTVYFIEYFFSSFIRIFFNNRKYKISLIQRLKNFYLSIKFILSFIIFFWRWGRGEGEGNNHVLRYIARYNTEHRNYLTVSLEKIFNKFNKKNCVFLKLDIEGNEYDILDEIIKVENFISGLVIEFHNIDRHINEISFFIKKLQLTLVHIHSNNDYVNDKNNNPTTIEMTFSHNPKPIDGKLSFPHIFDRKNRFLHDEIYLNFKGAKKNKKYLKIIST